MKNESTVRLVVLTLLVLMSFGVSAQGVAWEDLSRAQRELLADQETTWAELAPERQDRIALGARRYLEMNRSERRAARDRFTLWQDLDNRQRTELRRRYESYRRLPSNERDGLRDVYQRFNRLNRDRQDAIRDQFRRLPSERRQQLRDRTLRRNDRR